MKRICKETKVSGEVAIGYVSFYALVVEISIQGCGGWCMVVAQVGDASGDTAGSTFSGIGGECEPDGFTGDPIFLFCEAQAHGCNPREEECGNGGRFVFPALELETDIFEGEGVGAFVGLEVLAGPK